MRLRWLEKALHGLAETTESLAILFFFYGIWLKEHV